MSRWLKFKYPTYRGLCVNYVARLSWLIWFKDINSRSWGSYKIHLFPDISALLSLIVAIGDWPLGFAAGCVATSSYQWHPLYLLLLGLLMYNFICSSCSSWVRKRRKVLVRYFLSSPSFFVSDCKFLFITCFRHPKLKSRGFQIIASHNYSWPLLPFLLTCITRWHESPRSSISPATSRGSFVSQADLATPVQRRRAKISGFLPWETGETLPLPITGLLHRSIRS